MTRLVRWIAWATGICDDKGSPSAPKIGAALCIACALYVAARTLSFDSGTSFVIALALAALFGRSVFLHALDRGTWGFNRSDATQTNVTADLTEITKAVLARRDPVEGVEATE